MRLDTALAMEQSEEWMTGHRYLDMQVLEDVPEFSATAKTTFEVLVHDAALALLDYVGIPNVIEQIYTQFLTQLWMSLI